MDSSGAPLSLSVLAPAKINLWLRVRRRREDGFHELETRLAPLDLCDRLTLTVDHQLSTGTIGFTCDDPSVPSDESNLVVKAVRALEGATGPLPGMRLHLEKRIPHGAGLGGGSSDAAAALRLVKTAFCPELKPQVLHLAAAAVGSDVPFFLLGDVADASGRGEQLAPVPDFKARVGVLLVKLPFGIATPWAYRQWRESQEVLGLPYASQLTELGELQNDLERPVFEKYQVLGHLKAALLAAPQVTAALMSGSGSTVFAFLEEAAELATLAQLVTEVVGREVQLIATHLAPGLRSIAAPAEVTPLFARDVAF